MNDDQNSPWQYKPDGGAAAPNPGEPADSGQSSQRENAVKSVEWEAPQFIEQHHGAGWYAALVAGTAGLAALVYLAARDVIATSIIVIVGIIVGIFAGQKPGQAKYELNERGLIIDGKAYGYADYKSFAVIEEGSLTSVNLFPLKRFMPPLSAYFDPKDKKNITDTLGNYLPYEQRQLDGVERLSRRLRL